MVNWYSRDVFLASVRCSASGELVQSRRLFASVSSNTRKFRGVPMLKQCS